MATPSPKRRASPRHSSRPCCWAKAACTVGTPRRTPEPSITSSCSRANVCSSSNAAPASTTRASSGSPPAPTKAQWQKAGRSRLPPAVTSRCSADNGSTRSASTARQRATSAVSNVSMRAFTRVATRSRPAGADTGRDYVGLMTQGAFDLSGHVALVTGGNGGIGLGFADGLARAGADVAVWGTNEEKNKAAVEHLATHGTRVQAFRCDVGEEAEVEEAFAATVAAFGKVDSCFANAGVGTGGIPFLETSLDEWRRVTRVNLDGVFLTFRAAARHLVERGEGGSLVATASVAALEGTPRGEHYAAAKSGVTAMVRSLAVELARHGIRANAVLPGWIETAMTDAFLGAEVVQRKVLPRVPLGRWGVPDDFGGIAVYLASPVSAYQTGDTIVIDGGYTIF